MPSTPKVARKIPIPSFTDQATGTTASTTASASSPIDHESSASSTSAATSTTKPAQKLHKSSDRDNDENGILEMDWKEDWLKQIETALSIKFLPSRTRTDAPLSVSLEEFRNTLRSLTLEKKAQKFNGSGKPRKADEQVTECTLLLELLCVGSPSLYSFGQCKKRKEWKLELVPFGGNRLTHLKSLLEQTKSIPKKTYRQHRKAVKRAMKAEREQQERLPTLSSSSISSASSSSATGNLGTHKSSASTTPRANDEQEAPPRSKQAVSDSKRPPAQHPPHHVILKLADALWFHAQSILQYDAKQQRCAITFQDVVKQFSKLVLKASSAKQQLANALRDLRRLVPEFLSFDDSIGLKKTTTIWIHPSAYRILCEKLGSPLPPKKSNQCTNRLYSTPKSNRAPTNLKIAPSINRATKRSLSSISAAAAATAAFAMDNRAACVGRGAVDTTPSPTKRPRVSPSSPRPAAAVSKRPHPADDDDTYRYDDGEGDSTCPLRDQRRQKKRHKGLRINPHFILTDADYHGGEVIDREQELLLSDTTPRGLKRLFSQMNQGRRI